MEYSAKMMAAHLEIKADTLRKWETRYKLIKPSRQENGYRIYDEEDLWRVREFIRYSSQGMPGKEAAGKTLASVYPRNKNESSFQKTALKAVWDLDRGALEKVYALAMEEHGLSGSFNCIWVPVLTRLGQEAIKRGGLYIAREHFAVSFLRGKVISSKQMARTSPPRLALSVPEGDMHELGMLVAVAALQERNIGCLYLGANLPANSLVAALQQTKLKHVCITATKKLPRQLFRSLADALALQTPRVRVYRAGQGVLGLANLIPQLRGIFIGTDLQTGLDKIESGVNNR